MNRLVSIITLSIAALSTLVAQQDPEAKKILDAVNIKYKAYTSFQANITYKLEVTANTALNETFTADTKIKGDKFHIKKSDGEEFYCNGVYVWNIIAKDKEAYVSDFDPADKIVDLKKILEAYKSGYKYIKTADETLDGIKYAVIELNPIQSASKTTSSEFFKIKILINPANNEVKQWIIFEKNGNRHKFKINTFKPNVVFADTIFNYNYKAHPEITVEDLTDASAFSK
jgi:outer membrane lipoprotein-sorting protein